METLISRLKYIFLIALNVFVMILLVFYFFLSIKLSHSNDMMLQMSRSAVSNHYGVKGRNSNKYPLPYLFVCSTFGLSHKEDEISKNKEIINHFMKMLNHSVLFFTDPLYNRYIPSSPGIYKHLYDEYADIECIKRLFDIQNTVDSKHLHNRSSIYNIFTSSICFTKYATDMIKSNFYFWIDIKSLMKIKSVKSGIFPSRKFVISLPYIKRPLFFTLTEKRNKHIYTSLNQFLKSPFIQRTFWGGTKYSIQRISNSFWKEYDLFLRSKQLLVSEQNLFNALVVYYLEDSILVTQNVNKYVKRCTNDSSLFFAYYISSSSCSSTAITQNVKSFLRH